MGEIVHIEIRGDGVLEDENGNIYKKNGIFGVNNPDYDLIGYIPKELHYNILKTINNYYKNKENR